MSFGAGAYHRLQLNYRNNEKGKHQSSKGEGGSKDNHAACKDLPPEQGRDSPEVTCGDSSRHGGDEQSMLIQPDRSKSDYYCEVCDAHMNSIGMWESHIAGKRHLKNIKKDPDEVPSKSRTIKKENVPPKIQKLLDETPDPLLGLSYICELQRSEPIVDPMYTCYLCHATSTKSQIIEHLLSTKHRLNFFKEADPGVFNLIEGMKLHKEAKDTIVADKAYEWEQTNGREEMEVKIERTKIPSLSLLKKRSVIDLDEQTLGKRIRDEPLKSVQSSLLSARSDLSSLRPIDPKNIKRFPLHIKLRLLEELSQSPIANDREARVVLHVVNVLTQCLMQYKIRRLPPELQSRVAVELLSAERNNVMSMLDNAALQMNLASSMGSSDLRSFDSPRQNPDRNSLFSGRNQTRESGNFKGRAGGW